MNVYDYWPPYTIVYSGLLNFIATDFVLWWCFLHELPDPWCSWSQSLCSASAEASASISLDVASNTRCPSSALSTDPLRIISCAHTGSYERLCSSVGSVCVIMRLLLYACVCVCVCVYWGKYTQQLYNHTNASHRPPYI